MDFERRLDMHRLFWLVSVMVSFGLTGWAQDAAPLRVAIVGLVHGHVEGFLGPALKRNDIQIVGIAESDQAVAQKYAKQFNLDPKLLHSDVEEMLTKVKPQAVLVYTDTRDHRKVVETAARHHVPVMMEKPL